MTVTDRHLSILAVVALVMVVITGFLYGVDRTARTTVQEGALLVQGLDLEKVQRISLSEKEDALTLARGKNGFVVTDSHNYPAATKKINELLIKCLEIRIAEEVTTAPENHGNLGVKTDSEDATIVRFYGSDVPEAELAAEGKEDAPQEAKPLVALVVGKTVERGTGNYVRLLNQDTVYASEETVYLSTSPTSYMDTEITDVKKEDVAKVTVQLPDESYTISRKDGDIALTEVPEGKQQKDSEVEGVFGALSYVSFNKVLPADQVDAKWDATYTSVLKEEKHRTYTIQLAKADDKPYIRVAAQGPSDEMIEQSRRIRKDAPKEELEQKDAVLTAADEADAFTAKHKGWAYEISDWKAKKLRKPLEKLIEDIPEPDEPEEVSARHILIAFKGSERAGDDVTRSKDEAKALAEKVLKEAKAEDADFAALAKKYSDGPSATKGGDLGLFKKGKMHENFEKAAWKLDVDEISGVVETPFGFHIIQRTK
jgi:hypothetical protein